MADLLSIEELARRSGVPQASLQEWRARGLIGREHDTAFDPVDLQRVRFIRLVLRHGVAIDALAEAERTEGFLTRYLGFVPQESGPTYSVEEAAGQVRDDDDLLRGEEGVALLGGLGSAGRSQPKHRRNEKARAD